jgi:mannose-1-phosphate guanylyltransferase
MKAILLAAGLGSRLRPLTDDTPKCLVPIKGEPLLGIWLERLTLASIGPFLINTHYLASKVELFIKKNQYCNKVKIINEQKLLGTAGTLIANLEFFQGQDGLLIHADNYCTADIEKFILVHRNRPHKCLMTMMIFKTKEPSACGIVELDEQGIVINFHEKVEKPPGNLANGAIYLLSSELIEMLKMKEFSNANNFSTDILPKLLGRIYTYETKDILLDIGTIKNYNIANK